MKYFQSTENIKPCTPLANNLNGQKQFESDPEPYLRYPTLVRHVISEMSSEKMHQSRQEKSFTEF